MSKLMLKLSFISLFISLLVMSSCTRTEDADPVHKRLSQNTNMTLSPGNNASQQGVTLYNNRSAIKTNLELISQGLAFLLDDAVFSEIVATQCEANGITGNYKVDIAAAASTYQTQTGNTILSLIQLESQDSGIDMVRFEEVYAGFEIEGISLTTEIYLGFLNNNGDYENQNWDRETVDFVATAQLQNWEGSPAWNVSDGDLIPTSKSLDDSWTTPMWEVVVYADFFGDLGSGEYDVFWPWTAKCHCFQCINDPAHELCQRSASPSGRCRCRSGSGCPDNCTHTN